MKEIFDQLKELEQPTNRPLVVAISGFGGSGKTTLASKIMQRLLDCETVSADDFIVGRAMERSADWSSYDRERLQKQVLQPAQHGEPIRYQVYDWKNDKLGEWRNVPKSKYLIVEGLSILHPDLLRFYDFKIWVDCPLEVATERGMARDTFAANDHNALWLNIWMPNEHDFMAKYRPDLAADIKFNTNN